VKSIFTSRNYFFNDIRVKCNSSAMLYPSVFQWFKYNLKFELKTHSRTIESQIEVINIMKDSMIHQSFNKCHLINLYNVKYTPILQYSTYMLMYIRKIFQHEWTITRSALMAYDALCLHVTASISFPRRYSNSKVVMRNTSYVYCRIFFLRCDRNINRYNNYN